MTRPKFRRDHVDRRKSLQELEQADWVEPRGVETHLVASCRRLRSVPLDELTSADIRMLIGQQISLPRLVPLALEVLAVDPLLQASFYPGDLLGALLQIPMSFWARNHDFRDALCEVVMRARESIATNDEDFCHAIKRQLEDVATIWP